MLTPRGWWMLLLSLIVGSIGGVMALRGSSTLLVVCIGIVTWFIWEWANFCYRARVTIRELQVARTVSDNRGPVTTLWAGQSYGVAVGVTLRRGRIPFVVLTDRSPSGATVATGQARYVGTLAAGES